LKIFPDACLLVTRSLGGIIQESTPVGWITKGERERIRRQERQECFQELKRLFLPSRVTKVGELEILEKGMR
jgi:hypothetical protein